MGSRLSYSYRPVLEATQEAERQLLGSILIMPELINSAKNVVGPSDFHDSNFHNNLHARIFRAMTECKHPDEVSVAKHMNETGTLRRGDSAYLVQLIIDLVTPYDWEIQAGAVADYSRNRRIKYYTKKGDITKIHELTKPAAMTGIIAPGIEPPILGDD